MGCSCIDQASNAEVWLDWHALAKPLTSSSRLNPCQLFCSKTLDAGPWPAWKSNCWVLFQWPGWTLRMKCLKMPGDWRQSCCHSSGATYCSIQGCPVWGKTHILLLEILCFPPGKGVRTERILLTSLACSQTFLKKTLLCLPQAQRFPTC